MTLTGNIQPNTRVSMGAHTDAVRQAHRNSKFLIVYLHSPMHEDTNKFCEQVLCNLEIAEHCDRTALTWAGRVWDSEAYFPSQQLRVSTYPFMALLMPKSETMVEIADRVQGRIEASSLLARLRNVMRTFEGHLNRVRQAEQRRRADSLLERNRIVNSVRQRHRIALIGRDVSKRKEKKDKEPSKPRKQNVMPKRRRKLPLLRRRLQSIQRKQHCPMNPQQEQM